MHKATDYRIQAGGSVSFTDVCDEFVIYALGNNSVGHASVDGGPAKTFRNTVSAIGIPVDYPPVQNLDGNPIVTVIPAGAVGRHTLTISQAGSDIHLIAVEARVAVGGTVRVSNLGYNSKSLGTAGITAPANNDEVNALYGMPLMFDMVDADLAIIGLGTNDWQGLIDPEVVRSGLVTAVRRQRQVGVNAQGRAYAGGDAVLLWNPQPDLALSSLSWQAYRDVFYQVAQSEDVCLIDLGAAWGDFQSATAAGLFADPVHPSDRGAFDIASRVYSAIFHEMY
ncbi:SGNH/GDSL hydrolase family protein [Timonella senegalensis]|uniref:SGNH/GDSL hydrolase family protein n=1 Tax=Timonella senegalensis TaxID=1465825 RepID=UPI002FDD28EE